MSKILLPVLWCFIFGSSLEARIRLRKVKDPPRTCMVMKEDTLLSRPAKPIWSTERHSLVVADKLTLINDLGIKVCTWDKELFNSLGDLKSFRFYIDEYKEMIYPFIDRKEKGYVLFKVRFSDCSLTDQVTLAKLEMPTCDKPKKKKMKSSKKTSKIKSNIKSNKKK